METPAHAIRHPTNRIDLLALAVAHGRPVRLHALRTTASWHLELHRVHVPAKNLRASERLAHVLGEVVGPQGRAVSAARAADSLRSSLVAGSSKEFQIPGEVDD
ncbi:hypothetical protein [Amycolatopsis silviterrae]|uniref:DUF1876 domain-containing protein n=1 Tax=Amycolatopsis silviterrae TaxID=1656914 RepID=A0ABW5GZ27_9PSEU